MRTAALYIQIFALVWILQFFQITLSWFKAPEAFQIRAESSRSIDPSPKVQVILFATQVYVILRLLDGFTMEGYVMISYVLLIECINENKRQTFATQFRSLQVY